MRAAYQLAETSIGVAAALRFTFGAIAGPARYLRLVKEAHDKQARHCGGAPGWTAGGVTARTTVNTEVTK